MEGPQQMQEAQHMKSLQPVKGQEPNGYQDLLSGRTSSQTMMPKDFPELDLSEFMLYPELDMYARQFDVNRQF
jgi:hypothetical protein